jgi:hypothetical protein
VFSISFRNGKGWVIIPGVFRIVFNLLNVNRKWLIRYNSVVFVSQKLVQIPYGVSVNQLGGFTLPDVATERRLEVPEAALQIAQGGKRLKMK